MVGLLACLLASPSAATCRPEMPMPASTLASSWPVGLVFLLIAIFTGYAYLRAIYPREIIWDQEPEPREPLPPAETVARDAGV